jgi:ElaB/YqjD/DUF883 family membrane-anchored ribosome-binding protein
MSDDKMNTPMFSERTQNKVNEVKSSAKEALTGAQEAARLAGEDIKCEARKNADQAKMAVSNISCKTHRYASENPWMVVGIAAGLGLLVGVALSRR